MTITTFVQPVLVRSGEPGDSGQMVIIETHGMEKNVALVDRQQDVVSLGAPAAAAEAGRRVVEQFPQILGRLSEL